VFYFDRGLKLLKTGLAIDVRHRQASAFISHAHADHMARHELALCTPETARLYEHRLGRRRTKRMAYRRRLEWGDLRLTTFPAGHCLGSAMLLVEDGEQRLLYTGDFKLGPSLTAEEAQFPQADTLIMESTFGDPRYRFAAREVVIAQLLELVADAFDREQTPVIHAYVLGKAQEVTKILTGAGIPVLQHPDVFAVSEVYRRCGVDLGDYRLYPGHPTAGHAVVAPPRTMRTFRLPNLKRVVSFAVTGWAADRGAATRLGVDHALPLSDHADFDQLLQAAKLVEPREVFCTHGPPGFVEHLHAAGFRARYLG